MRTTTEQKQAKRAQLKQWAATIASAKRGTRRYREAANGIYRTFHDGLVHFFTIKMGASGEVARFDDLALVTLEKVFEKIHLYDPSRTELSTWVYRIATNCMIDDRRRRIKLDMVSVDGINFNQGSNGGDTDRDTFELPCAGMLPDERVSRDQRGTLVRAALKEIVNEKERKAVWLYYFEQRTYEEIAEEMDIPMNTVKVSIFRGKQRLAQTLRPLIAA